MISILPSEGLAPAQAAPKQNKISEPSSKPDDSSFSALVSRDASDGSPDTSTETAATDTARPMQAEGGDTPPRAPLAPALIGGEMNGDQNDASILPSEDPAALQIEPDIKQAATPAVPNETLSDAELALSATADSPQDSLIVSDADSIAQTKRGQTPILPGTANAEQLDAAKAEVDPAAKPITPSDTDVPIALDAADTQTKRGREAVLQSALPGDGAGLETDDAIKIIRQQDGVDLTGPETKLAKLASEADLAASATKSALATLNGETRVVATAAGTPDALISVAQVASTPAPAAVSGLTPVAPSIPVAAPSEINSIILNAVKNGGEPREQLIVQLDPPELGRVAIDFKFDAQGLQQITVTSENPEALRRLRELHFELTEALKDHGLSEQNLSFRQQADDQSQSSWSQQEHGRSGATFSMSDAPEKVSAPPPRSNASYAHANRLDLTL